MSSIKERLEKSQGKASTYVKLPIVMELSMKEDENQNIVFARYDTESKSNLLYREPIEGILIGTAFKLSAYDDNLGSKGGNYFSSHYATKDNITLFKPITNGAEVVVNGSYDEIEAWIARNTKAGMPKKKMCLFILNELGLVEVQTNVSIAIDQLNKVKEQVKERYVILTPVLYNEKLDISKKAKDFLGKFAKKNPPKFASVSVGDLISEENFDGWETEKVIDIFAQWKEERGKKDVAPPPAENAEQPTTNVFAKKNAEAAMKPNPKANAVTDEELAAGGIGHSEDDPF